MFNTVLDAVRVYTVAAASVMSAEDLDSSQLDHFVSDRDCKLVFPLVILFPYFRDFIMEIFNTEK